MSSTYRTNCPQCNGNNYSVWSDSSRGAYCWNCGYSERKSSAPVKILKRSPHVKQIREFYAEISEVYHNNLRDEHYIWLAKRGISEYSIKTLKIGYCSSDFHPLYNSRIAIVGGLYYKETITHKNRIVFPFINEHGVTDIWSRAYLPDDEIKYKGCFSPAFVRHADHAYLHDNCYKVNAHQYVIRTEGLIKAIVASQYGFPIIAYPGTLAYRPGTQPLVNQTQIIIYDNQRNHRRELIAAIKKEAERYISVKIGILPLMHEDKQDCDSFILKYGYDAFKRVIDTALEYKTWLQLVK